ncbi:MAG: hypothetical protein ABI779_13720 [Acidobacteriota bacterium]
MAIPNPPTALKFNQTQWIPSATPKRPLTLTWQPSPGATSYNIRVEDLTVPTLRGEGNNCPGDPLFACRNGIVNPAFLIIVRAGHAYRWWVHAVNAEGTSAASVATFRVAEPPADPNFTHGALQVLPLSPPYREIVTPSPEQWRMEVLFTRTAEQQTQSFTFRGDVYDRYGAVLATGSTPLPAGAAQRRELVFAVPSLAPGRYTLRVGVYDSANALVEKDDLEYEVHANAPVVRIAENGLLRRHSIPWFPLGFYLGEQWADEDFARMASWGANCVMEYGFGWLNYSNGNEQQAVDYAREFLDRAYRNGIGVLYNFAGHYQDRVPSPDQRNGLEVAVEYMRTLKSHPGLLTYYIADEPNLGGRIDRMPKLLAMQQLIADYDSDHPTWLVVVNGAKGVGDFHYRAADFLAVDNYPIPGQPLESVETSAKGNADSARGVRPNWIVPQLHDSSVYQNPPIASNEPTGQEKICMPMLALTAGATGIILYSYFDLFREVVVHPATGDYSLVPSSPQTLARRLAEVAALARHITSIVPALVAGTPQTLTPQAKTDVRHRAVELGGVMWVILANPTSLPLTSLYTLPAGAWGRADAPNGEVTGSLANATTLSVRVPARSGGTVRVERAGVLGARWVKMPDTATDIGAGADGAVWIIGTTPTSGGFDIRQFNGTGWTTIPRGAVRIAVGPTGPWVVNDAGVIFFRDATHFTQLPGRARDIGVGPRGEAWIIGTNAVAGGFGVHWFDGDEWRAVDGGGGLRIAVAPRGTPWIIDNANRILRHDGVRWVQLPGVGTDIDIGIDGTPWIVGADTAGGGFGIHRWDGVAWMRVDTGATGIAVAADGLPWVVNNQSAIFKRVR